MWLGVEPDATSTWVNCAVTEKVDRLQNVQIFESRTGSSILGPRRRSQAQKSYEACSLFSLRLHALAYRDASPDGLTSGHSDLYFGSCFAFGSAKCGATHTNFHTGVCVCVCVCVCVGPGHYDKPLSNERF